MSRFIIRDRSWHEERLRELDEFDLADRENFISACWHSTAIAYLEYGAFKDIDGPATEVDGKPVKIFPEFQLGIDSKGVPFMRHFTPEEWNAEKPL